MKNIAVFVSGNGTNLENLIERFSDKSKGINIALVLSNRHDAYALERAKRHGIASIVIKKAEFMSEGRLMPVLNESKIDFIVLAGFLLMIPDFLLRRFDRRIINIHPSLLPKFGGKGMYGEHVHRAIYEAREKETGMTVHYVTKDCDSGEIIAQFRTPLLPSDTPEEIARKERLLEKEHFPEIVEKVTNNTAFQH